MFQMKLNSEKYFIICKTGQSHVNKIKCCLEEPFQRVLLSYLQYADVAKVFNVTACKNFSSKGPEIVYLFGIVNDNL